MCVTCIIIGICGGAIGLCELLIALIFGVTATIGSVIAIGGTCCIGACVTIGSVFTIISAIVVAAVLSLFGIGIADLLAGGACSGYLGYFGTFIEQGGNLYDACRICVAGK